MNLGTPEVIIILVIVLLLFGVGRISKVSGELGKSIRAFKEGLEDKTDDDSEKEADNSEPAKKS